MKTSTVGRPWSESRSSTAASRRCKRCRIVGTTHLPTSPSNLLTADLHPATRLARAPATAGIGGLARSGPPLGGRQPGLDAPDLVVVLSAGAASRGDQVAHPLIAPCTQHSSNSILSRIREYFQR